MPKITHKKTADILQYRRNYYQENKARISKYQKEYYRLKKGLRPDHNLNWRGEKLKVMVIKHGEYKMSFE